MSLQTLVLSFAAAGSAILTGFLLGARVSRVHNQRLRRERDEAQEEARRQREEGKLRKEMLREQSDLGEAVQRLIAPIVERERIGRDLSEAGAGATRRGELPALLESIAERGSFEAVVLSDETGLPLAASRRADQPELMAACSSLILTLSDRLLASGQPVGRAMIIRDEAQRLTVHRIFAAGSERYVLIAITSAPSVSPEILDPALPRIEALLARAGWQPSERPA